MATAVRTFEDSEAVRSGVPLWVAIVSPSGAGKTYSALRLATGIQRVAGGDIWGIDTEAKRMLHYADDFRFRHLPFGAPFGPNDYLAAVEHCIRKGARTIIIDSMSHEHEGPGGVLEMHTTETERLVEAWKSTPDAVNQAAWKKPKSERRRLINTLLQMQANFIFCFRAKDKLRPVPGKKPEKVGWMPVGGEEWIYEMSIKALLMPMADGVPTWQPAKVAEQEMVKLPKQFRKLFGAQHQLCEDDGEFLARWAQGAVVLGDLAKTFVAEIETADAAALEAIQPRLLAAKTQLNKGEIGAIRNAVITRKAVLDAKTAPGPASQAEPQPPSESRERQPGEDDE